MDLGAKPLVENFIEYPPPPPSRIETVSLVAANEY